MSDCISEEALNEVLTDINNDYSKNQLNFLKFLAQSVVKYGLLESCKDIFDVHRMIRDSSICKGENCRVKLSLLRHFLQVTGCEKATKLSAFCSEEFELTTYAPSLPSYQLLFSLASKLVRNFEHFLFSIDTEKLDRSKDDLRVVPSPVELFQSMICKGSLHPGNPDMLKQELEEILSGAQLEHELQHYFSHPQGMLLIW